MANKWIQGAIKHPGALTAKAKAAGVSLSQFMQEKRKKSATNREIALARRLRAMTTTTRGRAKSNAVPESAGCPDPDCPVQTP